MSQKPVQFPTRAAFRAEKLSVLSALLGPEALAKLREDQPDVTAVGQEIDADRAAWHRNRLLKRLRGQSVNPRPADPQEGPTQTDIGNTSREAASQPRDIPALPKARPAGDHLRQTKGIDTRLAAIADPSTLGQEHPAVIARLMKGLSREERILTIKSLPGPIARSIVRRLR